MKKILSLMVCLTLAICSGIVLAACGKDKTPKPTFTVANDVKAKATLIVNELQTDVYNNADLETDHYGEDAYSYDDVKTALAETDKALTAGYWVDCGTLANMDLDKVTSIKLGGVEYAVGSTFKLSVGNNNFIEDDVVTIGTDGKVSIAAPIVAFELQRATSKITIGTTEFDFITNANAQVLKLGNAEFKNNANIAENDEKVTNVVTPVQGNEYDLKLSSSDDYLLLTPDTEEEEPALVADGKFLIRSVVDGKADKFGITGVDEQGLAIYFGRKNDNTVDPAIDGKTIRQDVYYTQTVGSVTTSRAASFTFNAEIVDGNAQLKAKYDEATAQEGTNEIKLDEDVVLTEAFTIDKEVALDLNGHTIDSYFTGIDTMFEIVDGGQLTVTDTSTAKTGKIIASGEDGYVFRVNDSDYTAQGEEVSLTIQGGYFETKSASVVSVTKGKVIIEGGSFKSTYSDPAYEGRDFTLNCINSASQDKTAVIEVKGGTFYKFNPSALTNNDVNVESYLPETGYEVATEGDWNTVNPVAED